jgi:hypothetical protein
LKVTSRVLVEKPEEKRLLWRPTRRWKDNIKMYIRNKMGMWNGLFWLRIQIIGEFF